MWEQLLPGLRIKLFLTVVLGVLYPLAMTGVSQLLFTDRANGSLIKKDAQIVGSALIGQSFTKASYFQPRPSSAGSGYDSLASSGSNLGPTSAKLLYGTTKIDDKKNEVVDFDGLGLRAVHYALDNGLPYESSIALDQFRDGGGHLNDVRLIKAFNDAKMPLAFRTKTPIPADAITGSASGLDPDISPANANIQAARVARARGVAVDQVKQLVSNLTEQPVFGVLGEPRVNVLRLNIALDQQFTIAH